MKTAKKITSGLRWTAMVPLLLLGCSDGGGGDASGTETAQDTWGDSGTGSEIVDTGSESNSADTGSARDTGTGSETADTGSARDTGTGSETTDTGSEQAVDTEEPTDDEDTSTLGTGFVPGTDSETASLDTESRTDTESATDEEPAFYPASCSELLFISPETPDGIYAIDPDGPGALKPFDAYCDMTTDGGGWTLVLSYLHKGGTRPALDVRIEDLPLLGSDELGADESGSQSWGHAGAALLAAFQPTELWFFGRSSAHERVLHFSTQDSGCLAYAMGAEGHCRGVEENHTPLEGHTANLPAGCNNVEGWSRSEGDYALTEDTFIASLDYQEWFYWSVGARTTEEGALVPTYWNMDDFDDEAPYGSDTLHRVFVRSAAEIDRTDGDGDGWNVYHGDCDDADPSRNPGERDLPDTDAFDANCDGRDGVVGRDAYVDPSLSVAALQETIDACAAKSGCHVLFAQGVYDISAPLALSTGASLHGGYAASFLERDLPAVTQGLTEGVTRLVGATKSYPQQQSETLVIEDAPGTVSLEGLRIEGPSPAPYPPVSTYAVRIFGSEDVRIKDSYVKGGKAPNAYDSTSASSGASGGSGDTTSGGASTCSVSGGAGGHLGDVPDDAKSEVGGTCPAVEGSSYPPTNGRSSGGGAAGVAVSAGSYQDKSTCATVSEWCRTWEVEEAQYVSSVASMDGQDGACGAHGRAGDGSVEGSIDEFGLWTPALPAGSGSAGTHGGGGAGGHFGGYYSLYSSFSSMWICRQRGGTGGGGGAGGCGGAGGQGGEHGRSSFGILVVDSALDIQNVTVALGRGGDGGNGARGGHGGCRGRGAQGGDPVTQQGCDWQSPCDNLWPACCREKGSIDWSGKAARGTTGGDGGDGGGGGGGAGGNGGSSFGIARDNAAVTQTGLDFDTDSAEAGAPGTGGGGGDAGNKAPQVCSSSSPCEGVAEDGRPGVVAAIKHAF